MDDVDEEKAAEQHRCDLRQMTIGVGEFPSERSAELDQALYAFNERGIWPDDLQISGYAALEIWSLVEAVRLAGFPQQLRM